LLFEEVLRQVRHIRNHPGHWLGQVREVGAANIRHAASGRFLTQYIETYDKPVVNRLAALVSAPSS
jgi:hypothetical protein